MINGTAGVAGRLESPAPVVTNGVVVADRVWIAWLRAGRRTAGKSVILVRRVWRGDGLALRRALLPQEDRQNHHRRDSQELALPVLERLEPEFARAHKLKRRNRLPAPLQLLAVELRRPADRVHDETQQEEHRE